MDEKKISKTEQRKLDAANKKDFIGNTFLAVMTAVAKKIRRCDGWPQGTAYLHQWQPLCAFQCIWYVCCDPDFSGWKCGSSADGVLSLSPQRAAVRIQSGSEKAEGVFEVLQKDADLVRS